MEQVQTPVQPQNTAATEEELLKLFESTGKAEKTPRGAKPQQTSNKKKKGKK
jgi:hypothetical protein